MKAECITDVFTTLGQVITEIATVKQITFFLSHFKTKTGSPYEKKNAVHYSKISVFILEIFQTSPILKAFLATFSIP